MDDIKLPEPDTRTDEHLPGYGEPAYTAGALRTAVLADREARGEPVLVVGGNASDPKFATVYVGPPAFVGTTALPAGTKLYTAPPPAIPAGWKLVPAEPTQQMCQEGQWKAQEWPKFPLRLVPIWKAMLAVAPEAPK